MTSKNDSSSEYGLDRAWTVDAQGSAFHASTSSSLIASLKSCNTPVRARSPLRSPSPSVDSSVYPRLPRGLTGIPLTFSPVITAKAQQLAPEKPFHIRLYQSPADKAESPSNARGSRPPRSGQVQPRSRSAEAGSRRGRGRENEEALRALYQEAFERQERMELRRALVEEQEEAERNSRKVSKTSESFVRRRLEKELKEAWESFVANEGGGQERLEVELQSISYPQLQRLLRNMGFFASPGDKASASKEEEQALDKIWCAMNVAGSPFIRHRDFMRVMGDLLDPREPRKSPSNKMPSKPAAAASEAAASDIGWEVTPIQWDNKDAAQTVNAVAAALHLTTSSTFAYSPIEPPASSPEGTELSFLQGLAASEKQQKAKESLPDPSLAALLAQKAQWRQGLSANRLHRAAIGTTLKAPVDVEVEECTFQPAINENSRRLGEANEEHWIEQVTASGGKLGREDLLYERDRQAKQRLEELRQQLQGKEVEGCTFRPAILAYAPPKRPDHPGLSGKATKVNTAAHTEPRAKGDTPVTTEEREVKEFCTFKPMVRAYDPPKRSSVRTESIIVGYDDHLKRLSQAKEERQQRRRWADNLRQQRPPGSYAARPETGEKCTVPKPFHFHLDDRPRSKPLLYVDVDLGEGKTGRLGVHATDDPAALAKKFAATHRLDDDLCAKLERLLATHVGQLEAGLRDKGYGQGPASPAADKPKDKPATGRMPRGVLMEPQQDAAVPASGDRDAGPSPTTPAPPPPEPVDVLAE
eukprot:EG_transcript_3175